MKNNAFTLIELSIVLVIIGLIVGGVLVGQDLIRAAQLRSVVNEQQSFVTAMNAFKLKYNCLPGDCGNATSFFPSTINGNNDGVIGTNGMQVSLRREGYRAWYQLATAGLISGTYTGATGPGHSNQDSIPGVNIPKSKVPDAGWCIGPSVVTWKFSNNYRNSLTIASSSDNDHNYCSTKIFYPYEAHSIDSKVDDGMPARGKVIAMPITFCTDAWTDVDDYDAQYSLTGSYSTSKHCFLNFRQ